MKFLILGCNGMAGHTIALYLKENKHNVLGFCRHKSEYVKCIVGDVRNLELLKGIIFTGKFDAIINCVGILNKFAEDNKSNATFINSYLPHFLADLTYDSETQIIQMSTDCVFSGKRGRYIESDFRDGETFYDRTKALGELEDNKNITLRNSIVGPDINVNGIGLMNWFLQQRQEVKGYTKSLWTGQTTLQLAKTMEFVAKERIYGLINAVPDSSISKYDLLMLFNKYIRKDKVKIIPVDGIVADKSLIRTRSDFDYIIPDYESMVIELSKWLSLHKGLYPHYNL